MSHDQTPDAGTRPSAVADVNAQMVDRLLSGVPAPLVEGTCALRVLETVGRRSGRLRRTPVGVLRRAEVSYLVCPDRGRDWPQNLLAHPRCVILAGAERDRYEAVPVEDREALESVSSYLSAVQVPWALAAFGLGKNPDDEQISRALPRMAVFGLNAARDDAAVPV